MTCISSLLGDEGGVKAKPLRYDTICSRYKGIFVF